MKYVRKKIGNSAPSIPLLQGVLFLTPLKYVRFCTPTPPPPRKRKDQIFTRKRTAMNVIDRMFSDFFKRSHDYKNCVMIANQTYLIPVIPVYFNIKFK